jgi:sulfotransferase family protein
MGIPEMPEIRSGFGRAVQRIGRIPNRLVRAYRARTARVNPAPLFILGNQKSGTSAIAALLARATGKSVTIDIFFRYREHLQERLLRQEMGFGDFIRWTRVCFSTEIVKEPSLTFFYGDLKSFFPQSRFIFVLRDPRDNIRSILNRLRIPGDLPELDAHHQEALRDKPGWALLMDGTLVGCGGGTYIERLAKRWQRAADVYGRGDGMVLVRYEDFMRDKAGAIRRLARAVSLEPTHDLGRYVDVPYQPRGQREVSWRDFFGPDNLRRIESICGDRMISLGYEPA